MEVISNELYELNSNELNYVSGAGSDIVFEIGGTTAILPQVSLPIGPADGVPVAEYIVND